MKLHPQQSYNLLNYYSDKRSRNFFSAVDDEVIQTAVDLNCLIIDRFCRYDNKLPIYSKTGGPAWELLSNE